MTSCTTTLLLLTTTLLLRSSLSQTCKNSCGDTPVRYPFGTGPGCGSPAFSPYVSCDAGRRALSFTTRSTGACYPVQSVDYANQVLYLSDPSMSTCSSASPSAGLSLDWDAPFSFLDSNVFALLDCSTSPASPLYNSSAGPPLCDASGSPVCSLLYSCPAISALDAPVSTCCIYSPASLGPAFEMDLRKLECGSYSGIYGFNGAEANPEGWKFGVALKYRFSVDDGYPSACADCEKSNGVCGYSGKFEAFTCNCPNGMNTTNNCYFADWSGADDRRPSPLVSMIVGFGLILTFSV